VTKAQLVVIYNHFSKPLILQKIITKKALTGGGGLVYEPLPESGRLMRRR
jgi:hypothetical protein